MMRKFIHWNYMVLILLISCNGSSLLSLALASSDPCDLFLKVDAENLFKESLAPGITRETSFPAGKTCRYSFNKNGDIYGLKIRVSQSAEIKAEGIQDSASDVMAHQKKARQANSNAAKTYLSISGLGDDAFWNGSDLWVLKGGSLIIITVNSFIKGTFKDMPSAASAKMEQNLALSQTVAKTILSRLK